MVIVNFIMICLLFYIIKDAPYTHIEILIRTRGQPFLLTPWYAGLCMFNVGMLNIIVVIVVTGMILTLPNKNKQ